MPSPLRVVHNQMQFSLVQGDEQKQGRAKKRVRTYKYQYNGKEFQDELNLNWVSMDMRNYDPAIGRWFVQDPVVHHSMSPYNAFDNNPIYWADPSGADACEGDCIDPNKVAWVIDYSGNLRRDDSGNILADQNKGIKATFFNTDGMKSDVVPEQITNAFRQEYGIELNYRNGYLIYKRDSEIMPLSYSSSARTIWKNLLGGRSNYSLSTGFDLFTLYVFRSSPDILGKRSILNLQKKEINFGVYSNNISYIDLADFNGQIPKGTFDIGLSNERSFNLGRIIEHEFIGHQVLGLHDNFTPSNPMGDTINMVNWFRYEIGVQRRTSYYPVKFGRSTFTPSRSVKSARNQVGSIEYIDEK